MSIQYDENSREFHLWNDQISYSFSILKNGHLGNLYFGRKLREREEFRTLPGAGAKRHGALRVRERFRVLSGAHPPGIFGIR